MILSSRSLCAIASGLILGLMTVGAVPASADEARLLRYPTIHDNFVVFDYGGDLWRVPSTGGRAWRLTAHEGIELTPKISPDGEWVAFSAEYSGTRQVYVMPSAGGIPKQLTFYNDVGDMPPRGGFDYWVQGWTPDGRILVRMNRTPWGERPGRYFVVDPAGGLERPLPIPIAGSAGYSPSGTKLAYTYYDREFRTWKRYEGGRNQDIWELDLETMTSKRLTDWAGSDNFPMWHGDTIYFTSDREHTLNIFAYDTSSGAVRKITNFDEYDVLWPSLGPKAIVFMNGGLIYRLDLETEQVQKIEVIVGDVVPTPVPTWIEVGDFIAEAAISPDGNRVVFEARGDLFSVPAKHGATRNLSATQGVRESSPAWSPDGRWIAYYSDESGEMELYVRGQEGSDRPRQLTEGTTSWLYPARWSPDSKHLAFGNSRSELQILDVGSGTSTVVDKGRRGDLDTYRWSPDSAWLVYETTHSDTRLAALALYSLSAGEVILVGDGLTNDYNPAFGTDGKYLFFQSDRDFNASFSDFEFNFVYNDASRIYGVALDPQVAPLFPLESDEVAIEGENEADDSTAKEGAAKDSDEKEAGPAKVSVIADGMGTRVIALPGIAAGNYNHLTAVDGGLLYQKFPADGPPALMRYDFEGKEEKEIAAGVQDYILAAKGEKVLFRQGDDWKIVGTKPGDEAESLDLSGLRMRLDQRAEWAQMFNEAWRIGRDWFYDENMHGVDWDLMRERYGALVPYIADRTDLDFIFGEMIGELEAGHCYVQSGDEPSVERIEGGMLGAELEADPSGRYRISKIFPGENWDDGWRSPLTELGVDAKVGDFLLAIDGVELDTTINPFALLDGKANQQVVLTLNSTPSTTGAREVKVKTITSEINLRYLDWVTSRAKLVDELSGGKIGYIHLPNTAIEGNRALQKYFYSQVSKPGLIVDERYNGGGFIPDRMIEMLSRTTLSYWARRGIEPFTTPGFRHDGPKVMLINGYAASGGDALPYYFRKQGLGQLVGTTTWGGLIGLSGNPMLVDGGGILYPTFRFYDTEGLWAVEGKGVAPDVEVWDLPEAIAAGGDPSIEKAVEILLQELEDYSGEPAVPTPPDMSGD